MTTYPLGAFLKLDKNLSITNLPEQLHKNTQASQPATTAYELDQLTFGNPHENSCKPPSRAEIPQASPTPNELENSQLHSSNADEGADVVQTLSSPPMNKYRFLSACLMCFGNGLNDSAPGALIPSIEKDYSIGYAIVSLIFVSNAVGFIGAVPLTHALEARLGRANMLVLAECTMLLAYIMLVCPPPFPVVVLAFLFLGFGMAFNLALNNVFCANLTNATAILGFFHGSYGIGGTVGPLIATALVSRGHSWSTFYFIALAIAALNVLFAYMAFRTYELDSLIPSATSTLHSTHSRPQPLSAPQALKSRLVKEALANKVTILSALFIFAYQGAEVSISGWVISFLITYRRSDPSRVGYVTAGFWGGITLGRFLLSHPAHRIGEKRAVAALVVGAAAFQVLVWQIPNVVGEAVAVSVVGLLLGPVYPCATAVISRLIGRRLQMSSLAAVSALGSSGGAVAPFFTGLLAQQAGTWVLHPICIGLFVGMLLCWATLPKETKRRE